ncbi:DUF3368 domain-containing protein [Haladaptatus cibarius]|uniref:DUF3368 domain-containing protein n=1 Tax=Haladaptatus cibarius TaxID=453847 RepID=UPI000679B02C|nr:hypothetical protein [Haladaptatus cibarius]
MSSVVITDTTVLIYLGKLGELDRLDALFDHALVPNAVYEEVVTRGREERYMDALSVEQAAESFLTVRSLEGDTAKRAERIENSAELGRGESAAIALALAENARCLTDDHAARKTAESLGTDVGGTIYVLLESLDSGTIGFEEYVSLLNDLTDNGFRMSASLYRRAVQMGRELRH